MAAVSAAFVLIFLSSCAVPLAPGYQIQKETLSVHFVAGSPLHLAIRAEYRLANIGNSPLHSFDVELPGEKSFGRANLRAEINGQEAPLQPEPAEQNPADSSGSLSRISLSSAWRQKEKVTLTLSYDLAAQPASDPRILVSANTFYLNDSGWFPQLLGFKALFAPSPTRPDPTNLSVVIPADFRVTASGQPRGTKNQNGEVAHQFAIHKTDFDPYVLAGQYNEQRASDNLVFWSSEPLPRNLQFPASDLSQSLHFYEALLGPLPHDNSRIYILNEDDMGDAGDPGIFAQFEKALPTAVTSVRKLDSHHLAAIFPTFTVNQILAATWFMHVIRPRPEAWLLPHGLDAYVAQLAEQQGGDHASRTNRVSFWIKAFDAMKTVRVERPVASFTLADDRYGDTNLGKVKVVLFLFALEDKCGQQNVTHAIHDMVYALRGEQYGYSDFRAALEQQCHQNLADFFRTWLAQPGIPSDFRARYSNAGANQQ